MTTMLDKIYLTGYLLYFQFLPILQFYYYCGDSEYIFGKCVASEGTIKISAEKETRYRLEME